MEFYEDDDDPPGALFDALIWVLDREPSPCRCIGEDVCRAHQALKKAHEAGIVSPHGRSYNE